MAKKDEIPFFFRGEQLAADEKAAADWDDKKEQLLRSLARERTPIIGEDLGWVFLYTRRNDEHFVESSRIQIARIADEYTARHLFFEARSGWVNLPWEDEPVPVHYFAIAQVIDGWDCGLKEASWMNPRRGLGGIRLCRVCDTYHYTHDERRMCPEYAREIGEPFDVTFAEVRRWREHRRAVGRIRE